MRTITIVGNGDYPKTEYPLWLIESADIVICCDAAFDTWRKKKHNGKQLPDYVIGDLDSLSKAVRKRYADRIIHFDEQDDNDQTKAIKYILSDILKPEETDVHIHIIGATGKREDHTVGNMALLMEYERRFHLAERGISCEIVSDYSTMFAITDSCSFDCGVGRAVSLFCPDNSVKIKSDGLQWPTDDVVFDNWWKATLNRATKDTVSLAFSHKTIALIVLA